MPAVHKAWPLILASASPRRQELLSLYQIPFRVEPSFADEQALGVGRERVKAIARQKCDEVFARHPNCLVLAADTLVCVDDEVMGKPKDEQDAQRMLSLLSGRTHEVHTGLCLRCPDLQVLLEAETTQVSFLPLSKELIARYVATGEPMDKAGAYALQGKAGLFISHIQGSPSNVIGLPLGLLTQFFERLGLPILQAANPH
ncbi:MAG: Maf family protein [Clostridia bacterium]